MDANHAANAKDFIEQWPFVLFIQDNAFFPGPVDRADASANPVAAIAINALVALDDGNPFLVFFRHKKLEDRKVKIALNPSLVGDLMPKRPPKGTFDIRRRQHEKKHGIGYGSKEQLAEEARRTAAGREIEAERKKFQKTRAKKKTVSRSASVRKRKPRVKAAK
jgi:hypothetical protein